MIPPRRAAQMPTMKRARRPLQRLTKHSASCASGAGAKCCASPGATSRHAPTLSETLHAVSDLADACIRAASAAAQLHLQPVFGMPRDSKREAVPLIVLGMGKLGGRELNFSSDIDLVFLFAQPGETDGPRVIDNEEYFTRLGRELIRLLDLRSADGFVFRVDMRLRPFGESGPLVVSLASLGGLPSGTRPRLGALCVDKGAPHRRRGQLRTRLRGIRAPIRVSPLPGFRRVRVPARHESADRARSLASRSGSAPEARHGAEFGKSSSSSNPCSWCAAAATGACRKPRCSRRCRCWRDSKLVSAADYRRAEPSVSGVAQGRERAADDARRAELTPCPTMSWIAPA